MRVTVDVRVCCSAGQCVLSAPELFDQRDEDGTVVLLDEHPPRALQRDAQDAEQRCPSGAIRVEPG